MLQPDLLAPLLKTVKNLTMLPAALEVLQNANAIEVLVGILAQQSEGKLAAVSPPPSAELRPLTLSAFAGDPKSRRQLALQPLSPEQDPSRGGSHRRRHSYPPASRLGQLAPQAVRLAHPLRLRSRQQDLQEAVSAARLSRNTQADPFDLQTVEARRSQLLPHSPPRQLLGQSRSRGYPCLVSDPLPSLAHQLIFSRPGCKMRPPESRSACWKQPPSSRSFAYSAKRRALHSSPFSSPSTRWDPSLPFSSTAR